jgi:hypothetical protein
VCVGIEPEEWVVMYICVCGYRARGVSSHVYNNHTHNYMTNHSSGLVQGRYPQAHIYMTTHMCVRVSTLYQARGVSSHLYICVGIKPEEWVVMYICVWLGLIPIHIYTWLLTPLFWYRVTDIYIWLLTPLAWHSHLYICVGIKPEEWVVMYICVCGY